jgi:hypothetical protein
LGCGADGQLGGDIIRPDPVLVFLSQLLNALVDGIESIL